MKKNLLLGSLFAFSMVVSCPVFSAGIGVFNINTINEKAKVIKSLNSQKNSKLDEIQKVVDSKRKDFEKREAELKTKSSMLSEEAKKSFMGEVAEFQKDVMEYDKETAQKVSNIEKAYMEALSKLQKDYLDPIVKKIGKDKGFDFILNSQAGVIINTDMDITDVVVEELNNQITEIKLDVK